MLLRRFVHSLIGFLLLAFGSLEVARARAVLDLDVANQPVALGNWGSYWLGTKGSTLNDFLNTPLDQRKATLTTGSYPLDRTRRLWIDVLIPAAADAERWYLEVPMPSLDHITVYTPDAAGNWSQQMAGDTISVKLWPVPSRFALMPVPVSAEAPTRIVVAIEHTQAFGAPLRFVSESYVNPREQRSALFNGVFFGLLIMAAAYSLLSAAVLRDLNYGLTALFISAIGLAQLATTGVGAATLWPESPVWADGARLIGALLATVVISFLYDRFSALGSRARWIRFSVWALAVVCVGSICAWILAAEPALVRDRLLIPLGALSLLACTMLPVWALLRGDRLAKWLVVGQTILAAPAVVQLLVFWRVIDYDSSFQFAMQAALAIQLPLLLIALALRAQERRVVHQRVADLSRVDGTSGLILPEVFEYRANLAIGRAKRFDHHAALLRVELTNLDAMRKEFGRKAVDAAQLALSERLLRGVRDIDSVGQIEEQVVGVLIEGPVTPGLINKLSTQLIARGLTGFAHLPKGLQLRMRVFIAQLPFHELDSSKVMSQLKAAADTHPVDERKAIYFVTPDRSMPAEEFLRR